MSPVPADQHCCSCAAGFHAICWLPVAETCVGMFSSNMHDLPDGMHHLTPMFGDLNLFNPAYACCTLSCGSGLLQQQQN